MSVPFVSCSKGKSSETVVRIAIQPSAAFIPLYVARYSGFIENALKEKNVKVIWQDFESGPSINESLFADLSDIGVIGDVPTVVALSGTTKMKLVGIPARGPDAYALLARIDNNNFNSWKDIKGKRIATVFGSTGHNLTKKFLEKNSLTFEDINFYNIATADAAEALTYGAVDGVIIWEPNITRLTEGGIAKIVSQGSDTDLQGTNGFVVREEFLEKNPLVIKEILTQYKKAVSILDSMDDSMLYKLSAALYITPAQTKSIIKKYDYSVKITSEDTKSLQDTINFLVSINNLPAEFKVEHFIYKFED